MRNIEAGDVLDGFCGGLFGRDSYDDKIVIAIGTRWVVAMEITESRHIVTATVPRGESIRDELAAYLKDYPLVDPG